MSPATTPPPTRCVIALGSNLGDRLENVRAGATRLRDTDGIDVVAFSTLYETAPVGGPDNQGPVPQRGARRRHHTRR